MATIKELQLKRLALISEFDKNAFLANEVQTKNDTLGERRNAVIKNFDAATNTLQTKLQERAKGRQAIDTRFDGEAKSNKVSAERLGTKAATLNAQIADIDAAIKAAENA